MRSPQDGEPREDDAQSDQDHPDQERLANLARNAQDDSANSRGILSAGSLAQCNRPDAVLPSVELNAHLRALIDHPWPCGRHDPFRDDDVPGDLR
ncbi:MAG: hypothetical protein IPN98_16660 [Propionivibrio sp.]|jgi:hypothetical protein|nr:hypothetical protein [Propionivibrio sp.]